MKSLSEASLLQKPEERQFMYRVTQMTNVFALRMIMTRVPRPGRGGTAAATALSAGTMQMFLDLLISAACSF